MLLLQRVQGNTQLPVKPQLQWMLLLPRVQSDTPPPVSLASPTLSLSLHQNEEERHNIIIIVIIIS